MHLLADPGRVWQCGARCRVSGRGYWFAGRVAGVWPDGGDRRLCLWPYFGGHFNPAVSIGLVVGKRFSASELPGYIISQVLGAIAAAAVLYLIVSGKAGFSGVGGFVSNGYGANSPGGFSLLSVLVCEVVMTALFLIVILGSTAKRAAGGFGGLSIGLCLTLIHLVSIPVSNTSVNPARSTGPALFAQTGAMGDLWLFWVAPMVGAILGALIYNTLLSDE